MKIATTVMALSFLFIGQAFAQNKKSNQRKMKETEQNEHYTFQLSDKVTRKAVTFKNRYGIKLSGDLYLPKNAGNEKLQHWQSADRLVR